MSRALPDRGPILIVSEGISFCHVVRPLIISQWLKPLGRKMTVACPDKHQKLFASLGLPTIPLKTANPKKVYSRLAAGGTLYSAAEIGAYYRDDEKLLRQLKPALVVADFRFTIQQLCQERHNIPVVGITSASCHPHFEIDGTTPNCFLPPILPPSLTDRLQRTPLGRVITRWTIQSLTKPYRLASKRAGLKELPTFFHYASQGNLCALADHPAVMPIIRKRNQDLYTGPLLWERDEPLPDPLKDRRSRNPLLYITVGTQDSMSTAFLDLLLTRLLARGFSVVLSKGNRNFNVTVKHPELLVFDFINESKLMPLVDAWIYHGSAMSTYQGLCAGVPLISLPTQADQHFHSEAVVRLGCGFLIRPRELDLDRIVALAKQIVDDDSTRSKAREVASMLRGYAGRSRFVSRTSELIGAWE